MYEIFRDLCDRRGYTDYYIAKAIGISATILTRWKQGKTVPKYNVIKKIADFLDVSVEYLMGEKNIHEECNFDIGSDIDLILKKIDEDSILITFEGRKLTETERSLTKAQIQMLLDTLKHIYGSHQ